MSELKKEILRYLGYKSDKMGEVDPLIDSYIEDAVKLLRENCRPRHLWKRLPLKIDNGRSICFDDGAMRVESEKLAYNLRDCSEAAVMAATLGVEADILITKYSRRNISRGVIVEAAATALIEEYCDMVQQSIADELMKEGRYLRPRFSPGYGDFGISHQKDVMAILECPKRMGLTMTDGFMLTPTKSVTAVIGITEKNDKCSIKGCEACDKKDCEYRRNR